MRVGIGYDVHPFADGRRLVLGGVTVPHSQGLAGHSDADVLVHAIIDALLGAAGKGDIGGMFPDTDHQYKDISSLVLLEQANHSIMESGWRAEYIDSVLVAEAPRLASYFEQMRDNIAAALGIHSNSINIKATTTEGLGFTGRKEGIAAQAVALLIKDKERSAG